MISVRKYIYNGRVPRRETITKYFCDGCGSEIDKGYGEKLWQYKDQQLCGDCLMETLEADGTIREVE